MERRTAATLAVAGVLSPGATVGAVVAAAAAYGIPWIGLAIVLVASPALALGSLYVSVLQTGTVRTPEWFPLDTERTLREQVPARYHETFAPETLDGPTDTEVGRNGRLVALPFVYLAAVPTYALALWLLAGG